MIKLIDIINEITIKDPTRIPVELYGTYNNFRSYSFNIEDLFPEIKFINIKSSTINAYLSDYLSNKWEFYISININDDDNENVYEQYIPIVKEWADSHGYNFDTDHSYDDVYYYDVYIEPTSDVFELFDIDPSDFKK